MNPFRALKRFVRPTKARGSSRRRVRPSLETLENREVPTVTYHGGPLLTSVKIENYFYGPAWNAVLATTRQPHRFE